MKNDTHAGKFGFVGAATGFVNGQKNKFLSQLQHLQKQCFYNTAFGVSGFFT
jgi:hypothetical protein